MVLRSLRPVSALLRQPEGRRFFIFLLVGALNTAVGYGLFAAFIFLGASTTLALAAATVLGVLFNFKSIGRIVFASGNVRLLPRFVGIYVVQFGINLVALKALESAGASPLLAQLLILPPLAIMSFIMMRQFVFRPVAQVEKPPPH
jgi:putative flippase GtrA